MDDEIRAPSPNVVQMLPASHLFIALASATVTAYAIAYVAHFEWQFSRSVVRTDALFVAAVLGVVFGLKILLQGRCKRQNRFLYVEFPTAEHVVPRKPRQKVCLQIPHAASRDARIEQQA